MTLDEAIQHCEEVASRCEFDTDWGMGNHFIDRSGVVDEIECAKEHRQLAEWLKDYKRLLEQEPCEDCIGRQVAIDALESIGSLDTEADKKYARSVFEALPSVTPQPKTGHWIVNKKVDTAYDISGYKSWAVSYACEHCGFIHQAIENHGVYSYCPNCGARMVELQERSGEE